MSNPAEKSTPPPSWEDQPALREHFLAYLPADRAEALRSVGEFLFLTVLESGYVAHDRGAQLRGVAADLEAAASVLSMLAEEYPFEGTRNPLAEYASGLRSLTVELTKVAPNT